MKEQKTNSEKYMVLCKRCRNDKGVIRKYNLNICRRCFKDIALNIGFKKFG
ncbi:MAG: 30S ribosomal protein S14 [Candidatus Diapherotrites archaeon]|nr:30S ribosomal protein S14 [Candidatus Diapherotrites archaeon]